MDKESPRKILLMALGTTPHLTTVTLSAIYKTYPCEMPTEIHVVTTRLGAQKARQAYNGDAGNILKSFYNDYGLPEVTIPEENIHEIPDEEGLPLSDIRTQSDSVRAADYIINLVRELCADPNSQLHVSIVGGRKSMGMLLGSAMTFYGRDQDRISHVLSSEAQENSRQPYPQCEALLKNSGLISLGEIPFLRLRPILPEALLKGGYSYSEIIQASQQKLTSPTRIEIRKNNKNRYILLCEGIAVKSENRCLGLYIWLATRKKLGRITKTSYTTVPLEESFFLRWQYVKLLKLIQTETTYSNSCVAFLGLTDDRLERIEKQFMCSNFADHVSYYQAIIRVLSDEERTCVNRAARDFSNKLSNPRTKINDKIKEVLGDAIPDVTHRKLSNYLISSNGQKEDCIYEISVNPENIHLPEDEKFASWFADSISKVNDYWKVV